MAENEIIRTYQEQFPVGSQVIIHAANEQDGTDWLWHRHTGTVKKWSGNGFAAIQMDIPKRNWRQPIWICSHHIREAR